jgi:RHS repeat-associated protein
MGHLLKERNGTQDMTTWAYNALGQNTSVTAPNGGTTSKKYDEMGRMTEIIDPNGNKTSYSYDSLGQLTDQTDPLGNTVHYEYDKNGNQTKVIDPLGNESNFSYDEENQLVQVTDPLGKSTQMEYDLLGNRTSMTLPNHTTWSYSYNERGQMDKVEEPTGTATRYAYDNAGRLHSVLNGNNQTTSYTYDSLGNLESVTDPLGASETFLYDANRNKIQASDRNGNVVQYDYDERSRLTSVQSNDGASITYRYDGEGHRTSMTDQTGKTSYHYNENGQLEEKVLPDGKSISYSYDLAGNVVDSIDYSGTTVHWDYDEAGRVKKVEDSDGNKAQYSYDAAGRRSTLTLPGGIVVSYQYDANNQVTAVESSHPNNDLLQKFTYAYDEVGNVIEKTDGKGTTTFTYDPVNRLLSYIDPSGTQTGYTYDAVGNRVRESVSDGDTKQYTYDEANRLIRVNSAGDVTTFTYDFNGNLLNDGKNTYSYNAFNQLVESNGNEHRSYAYDGDGYRVSSSRDNQTTHFYWDGDQLSLEVNQDGNIIARNLYGLERIARIVGEGSVAYKQDGNNVGYYLYDGHQNVRMMTDANGQELGTFDYDPWGKETEPSNGWDNPFRYGGEYQDEGTELYYLRSRFYSPELARFTTEDTYTGSLANPASLNLYTYVENNPEKYLDPSGHFPTLPELGSAAGSWITGVGEGVYDGVSDTVNAVVHYDQTWEDIKTIARNPGAAIQAMWDSEVDQWNEATRCNDLDTEERYVGRKTGSLLAGALGSKGLSRIAGALRGAAKSGMLREMLLDETGAIQFGKGAGKLTGSLDGLKSYEKTVVNDLVAQGKKVEIIPKSTEQGVKTPDFYVDGVRTELKTLTGTSLNTGVTRIQEGFKQGASTVIIDARQNGMTIENAQSVLNRAAGTYPDKVLPGRVEIWTGDGVISR